MARVVLNVGCSGAHHPPRSGVLTKAGFQVVEARTGAEALALLATTAPAVILMEPEMADMTVAGICRTLKDRPATSTIPIICITSGQGEGSDARADAVLTQPVTGETLIAVIETVLRGSSARAAEASRNRDAFDVLETIPDAFLTFDSNCRLTYANAEAQRLLGHCRQEMLGRTYAELDPTSAGVLLDQTCRRVLQDGCTATFENHYERSGRWFDVKAYPLPDGRLTVYFRDISEAKRTKGALESTEKRLLRLLDSSIIGVATATTDGLSYANDEFLRVIGYTREDLEARRADWLKATPAEDVPKDMRALEEMTTRGECTPYEKSYVHADGTRIPIIIGAAKLRDDPLEWVAYVIDNTARKQAEEALQLNQQRLQLAADSAGIGAWDLELTTRRVSADQQVSRMFGFDHPNAELSDWISRIHPSDRQRADAELRSAADDTGLYETEYRTVQDAKERWVYSKGTVLRDSDGSAVRIVGIAQDITERKFREQQLADLSARLEFHLHNTPVAVIEYDSNFNITRWGGQAERTFGWTAQDVMGKRFDEFRWVHDDDAARVQEVAAGLADGSSASVRCENRNYRKDGGVVYMEWYNSARSDAEGKLSSLLCLSIDVTARTEAEQALRTLSTELRASNEDLQQFAYAVSHDLQEPLRSVNAFADLLRRRFGNTLPEQGLELLRFISEGAERMQRLVLDLLEYSRVGQQCVANFGFVRLEGALAFAVSNLTQSIAESKAVITHDPLPDIAGDAIRLCQLFQNLIGNAIKYRRPDAPPRIHIAAERLGHTEWHFGVRDNGIGIDEQFRDEIFGVFKRLHGRDIPGNGIGLAIAKKIVERHGGRIWVESEPGVGSTFHFTLASDLSQQFSAAEA